MISLGRAPTHSNVEVLIHIGTFPPRIERKHEILKSLLFLTCIISAVVITSVTSSTRQLKDGKIRL